MGRLYVPHMYMHTFLYTYSALPVIHTVYAHMYTLIPMLPTIQSAFPI